MQNTLSMLDMERAVEGFLHRYRSGITTLHNMYIQDHNSLSLSALIAQLGQELKTGCTSYYNQHNSLDGIDSYLFYITNSICKRFNQIPVKKHTEYICPGCLFLGKINLVNPFDNFCFKCEECWLQAKTESDPRQLSFYKTFSVHHKLGFRCPDCERFIPHPVDNISTVSCPYYDCYYVGEYTDLRRMYHPTSKTNLERLILDTLEDNGPVLKDNLVSSDPHALSSLEDKRDLEDKVRLIQDIIFSQSGHIFYTSNDYTIKHKQLVYQAFSTLLKKSPQEMVSYLLERSRSGGFQHKIFQEYVKLLEEALPFFIKKGTKRYRVDSLLSEHLCIFNGISIFNSLITSKLEIKNETNEFYIGGRKATYAQPYYIGKLLNIVRQDNKEPILHLVKEYTFSRIRLREVKPQVPVIVTHLRIPPHYQMGGMVYVNRVRKKIVERALASLQKVDHD